MTSGAFLLRRSRVTLAEPVLSRYSIGQGDLYFRRHDGVSSDCTEGYTISRNRRRTARESIDWFRALAEIESYVAVSASHRHVDPAHVIEAGTEPGIQARHAAIGTRCQYWGDGSGSRINRFVRESNPEDISTVNPTITPMVGSGPITRRTRSCGQGFSVNGPRSPRTRRCVQ